jgi:hypothetical protein
MWLRYYHTWAWGDSNSEYIYLGESFDSNNIQDILDELSDQFNYSDKYRGIEYELVKYPGDEIVKDKIKSLSKEIKDAKKQIKILRLQKNNHEISVAMTSFARKRHTKDGPYSWFDGSEEYLIYLIKKHFHEAVPGYRDGVVLVPVPPKDFYSSTVQLKGGEKLEGEYAPRQEGEEPRKRMWVKCGSKMPAKTVHIVLYSHETLLEKQENETDKDWEIVSINASPTDGEQPMTVGTLLSNYFGVSGGTDTKMTPEQLVGELKDAFFYWRDKALACG